MIYLWIARGPESGLLKKKVQTQVHYIVSALICSMGNTGGVLEDGCLKPVLLPFCFWLQLVP